jgi:RHS repeat-associated protein
MTTFTYDGLGNRVAKNATKYLVDPFAPPPAVLQAEAGSTTRYVYAGRTLLKAITAGTPTVFLRDGKGSTRLLADGSGAITDTYDYDAWGVLAAHAGTSSNPFLDNGQQLDAETGFYYLRARYYAPFLQAFVAASPVPGAPAYAYANGDPVNHAEPDGLDVVPR